MEVIMGVNYSYKRKRSQLRMEKKYGNRIVQYSVEVDIGCALT